MITKTKTEKLKEILKVLPNELQNLVSKMDSETIEKIREIRIRKDAPLSLSIEGKQYFIDVGANLSVKPISKPFIIYADEMDNIFSRMTNFSVHSHMPEILGGFITIDGGHRVGICGKALYENEKMISIRDITTLSIRIARNFPGLSKPLLKKVFESGLQGLIIAGEPGSGKTTLLRDMAKQLSNGFLGQSYRVAVIDERFEIAGTNKNAENYDVLSGYPKDRGILQAVRTLSPDIIICDELGTVSEADAIIAGLNTGVPIITTIHASNLNECKNKLQLKPLIEHKTFENLVLLEGKTAPGNIKEIVKRDDLYDKTNRHYPDNYIGSSVRKFQIQ